MGFLQKLGLVEQEEMDVPSVVGGETAVNTVAVVDAKVDSAENVVEDIYSQNGLSDKGDSIYAVQEYIATLPAEMTTPTKQKTVSGILAVSKKSIQTLLEDAENRIVVLQAAKEKIVADNKAEIDAANADIETMKRAIEAANIKIREHQDIIAATVSSVDNEVNVLSGLKDFCSGMEVK